MKFTIITVCYNSEKTIERTLISVLNQSFSDFEYIVVDGKSTDSTLDIAKSFIPKFAERKIKFNIISETDNGIYDAMNKGIKMAYGDLICMINSDDWFEPNALAFVNEEYEKNKSDFIYGDINIIKSNGHSFVKKSRVMKHYFTTRHWSHPSSFISKNLYNKIGLYENRTIYDDWDLVLRIFKSNAKISVVNKIISNFSMNGVSHKKGFKAAFERAKLKYSIYRKNGYSRIYWFECYFLEILKAIIR